MDPGIEAAIRAERIYLPAIHEYDSDDTLGVPLDEGIDSYMAREFPQPLDEKTANYSIPHTFIPLGEAQASKAEEDTYTRLRGMACPLNASGPLWQVCFQGACYAGRSQRNERDGKLIMREHDFVVFNIFEGKYYISLIEVKSTCDESTTGRIISNPNAIKSNKRGGLHQLRDHMEILEMACEIPTNKVNCFLFWPFLTMWTKDPTGNKIRRWEADGDKHLFTDTIADQDAFNDWFFKTIISGDSVEKCHFDSLFRRFIVMSCGIFVNEIHNGMLALLSQEQVGLLHKKPSFDGSSVIVHGAAGTGKTLLVLHKLRMLYDCGLLNEKNRALYICYWPGIRADFCQKLKKLNIEEYVDTVRFFISRNDFLQKTASKYRHIFMDECEAICLAFSEEIITKTFENIHSCRLTEPDETYDLASYNGVTNGVPPTYTIEKNEIVRKDPPVARTEKLFGELWFLVDINQAALFLPKFSPQILKSPHIVLSRVMRNTGIIFKVFSHFYTNPIPMYSHLASMYLNNIDIGHSIKGPPIYWVNSDKINDTSKVTSESYSPTFDCMIRVVIDLFSTKGVKPNDLCVLPFVVTLMYFPENINQAISAHYAKGTYHPTSIAHVEEFLSDCEPNVFLVPWVLRVKGLEFKVVVLAIEQDDFDKMDMEDRRKIYIMASRCTCLLILVSSEACKDSIDEYKVIQNYPFGITF